MRWRLSLVWIVCDLVFVACSIGSEARAAAGDYEASAVCGGGTFGAGIAVIASSIDLPLDPSTSDERLAWRVRVLATAGPRGLRLIGRSIPLANDLQKAAIGTGLARAAAACEQRDGIITTEIADSIRDASDGAVAAAFTKYLTNARDSGDSTIEDQPAEGLARLPASGAIDDAKRYFDGPIDRDPGLNLR
jgi:hypothetical protein